MTNKKPNSDTGGRAQRRRAEREVKKAPPVQGQDDAMPLQQQGPQITADDAFRKIGAMELELDWWKQEAAKKDRQITKLAEALAEAGKPKAEKTSEEETPE